MPIKQPLADQMRPKTLEDFVGQDDLLAEGMPLYQIITEKVPISLILWGAPGTGKSSMAEIIAKQYNVPFQKFNASIDNKAKLTNIIDSYPNQTIVLLIDEIHRMTKNVQDYLLPYLESGQVMLVGATTENPIMSVVPAVRSRCQIFEFKALTNQDVETVLKRALKRVYHFSEEQIDDEAVKMIAATADGDLRIGLNLLETIHAINQNNITVSTVTEFVKGQHFSYDKKSTKHYDYLSAYSDSMAGSDTDAALYYLAVLLKNGDLPSVVRRLREIPYTYVGLASPEQATQIVIAANQAEKVGMPKAKYPLMFATMLMCLSPKSGVFDEIWDKLDEPSDHPSQYPMPRGLRDMHYKHSEEITGGGLFDNPFSNQFQIAKQNYMPKGLEGTRFYYAKDNANEKELEKRYLKLHRYIYGDDYKK